MNKKEKCKKVDILGAEYTVYFCNEQEDTKLQSMEGYTDSYTKKIVVIDIKTREDFKNEETNKCTIIQNKILRHEILHAFLYESGLDCNSNKSYNWAVNEEMVDWFAIQSPKILKCFKELNIEDIDKTYM